MGIHKTQACETFGIVSWRQILQGAEKRVQLLYPILPKGKEVTKVVLQNASTHGDSDEHSTGSNTTLSSHPGPQAVRHSWQSEERWNPNHSPRFARVAQTGIISCDQIPQTPDRTRRESLCRWSSSMSSSPSLSKGDALDSKLFIPQRVVSEVDHDAEIKVIPTIPSLKPLTESSPPKPSGPKKAPSAS
mmetsp:Transcript_13782/g.33381  ORF Transcript_13782/g.33381 Transcript_13782/m.33381 type:complete len:189 (-) Transcript_13782:26-592(-)